MNEVKLSIQDVNLYYGDFHALHGISMDIKANEITSLSDRVVVEKYAFKINQSYERSGGRL